MVILYEFILNDIVMNQFTMSFLHFTRIFRNRFRHFESFHMEIPHLKYFSYKTAPTALW